MTAPCPNCFVVSAETTGQKEALFHLSAMLLESKCYRIYLKGSVIPFIYIDDVKKLLKSNQKYLNEGDLQTKFEATKELKSIFLRSFKLEGYKNPRIKLGFK